MQSGAAAIPAFRAEVSASSFEASENATKKLSELERFAADLVGDVAGMRHYEGYTGLLAACELTLQAFD